jgi:hypothetical protein
MTEYTNEEFYNLYKNRLEKWLDNNVYQYANDIVPFLLEKEIITHDDFENYYKIINREDYESEEDYKEALYEDTPQEIYEWYLVSEEAYNKFGKVGDVVVKFKDLHFWGRGCSGQKILIDYLYDRDAIKIILNL